MVWTCVLDSCDHPDDNTGTLLVHQSLHRLARQTRLNDNNNNCFPRQSCKRNKRSMWNRHELRRPVFYLSVFQLIPEWAKNCKILTFLNSCNSYSFSFPKNIILTSMAYLNVTRIKLNLYMLMKLKIIKPHATRCLLNKVILLINEFGLWHYYVWNDHLSTTTGLNLAQTNYFGETSFQWPPLHKNHFFGVPSVIKELKFYFS